MIFKFDLNEENFIDLMKCFKYAEIYNDKVIPNDEELNRIIALRKSIENSAYGKVNVTVEGEE